jgi:carboxyl-terminal processing protease
MKTTKSVFALLLLLCSLAVHAQLTVAEPPASSDVRARTFSMVWNIVNERHFDKTFGGVDWQKVGEAYKPEALAAKSDEELHRILNRMVGELNQSHFNIYTRESEAESNKCVEGIVGLEMKLIAGQLLVTKVESGSPAAKSGLRSGFEIRRIGGKSKDELLLDLEASLSVRKLSDGVKQTYRERTLNRNLCGAKGSAVQLEIADERSRVRTLTIERVEFAGETERVAAGLPLQKLYFEKRMITPEIGYVRFNIWIRKQAERAREAIISMTDAKAIIIDLRGNAGGQGGLVANVGGPLFSERTSFGVSKTRFGTGEFVVVPDAALFAGKVIVLTDNGTGSTSEIFAAGMKDNGRAVIIGERTAGAVLPATIERLPTGANFMYAVADYRSPKGLILEGVGVEPDIKASLTRASLLEGRDLQLEAALRFLSDKN